MFASKRTKIRWYSLYSFSLFSLYQWVKHFFAPWITAFVCSERKSKVRNSCKVLCIYVMAVSTHPLLIVATINLNFKLKMIFTLNHCQLTPLYEKEPCPQRSIYMLFLMQSLIMTKTFLKQKNRIQQHISTCNEVAQSLSKIFTDTHTDYKCLLEYHGNIKQTTLPLFSLTIVNFGRFEVKHSWQ